MDGNLGTHLEIVRALRNEHLAKAARERRVREAFAHRSWCTPAAVTYLTSIISALRSGARRSFPASREQVIAPRPT